jgi:hypothetical protein
MTTRQAHEHDKAQQRSAALTAAIQYSAVDAAQDLSAGFMGSFGTSPDSGSNFGPYGDGMPPPWQEGDAKPWSIPAGGGVHPMVPIQPNIQPSQPQPVVPAIPRTPPYTMDGTAPVPRGKDFTDVLAKIALDLENLPDDEIAERLKAAKQINLLVNQMLAVMFGSGLADMQTSLDLIQQLQDAKAESLAIMNAMINHLTGEEEDDDGEEDDDEER